jgi:hypothetical protein
VPFFTRTERYQQADIGIAFQCDANSPTYRFANAPAYCQTDQFANRRADSRPNLSHPAHDADSHRSISYPARGADSRVNIYGHSHHSPHLDCHCDEHTGRHRHVYHPTIRRVKHSCADPP